MLDSGGSTVAINNNPNSKIYTPDESVEAYLELKAALALVSNKLDDGKKQAIKGISKTKSIPVIK